MKNDQTIINGTKKNLTIENQRDVRHMGIRELRAIRGSNYYSRHPVIFMELDIGVLEEVPTDRMPGFREMLAQMMPSLHEHKCSPGYVGGFYERIVRGTWAGHVTEHIAIELQCLAGHEVAFGKTYSTDEHSVYHLVFRYMDEKTGLRAGEMAVDIVEDLFRGKITDVGPLIRELQEIYEAGMLGPSTKSIVDEAARRGISHIRLNEDSYVQLGQGKYQRRLQATMTDTTSALGVEIADDKERTKQILASMGIPVPCGRSADTLEETRKAARDIGFPVVVKPLVGNHGRGITVNVRNEEELAIAHELASGIHSTCLVEQYIRGHDFRVLVIDGKFTAAALREPACVIGNGRDTITELVAEVNRDPERGDGHEKNLTKIHIDAATKHLLELQDLSPESILPEGKKVYLKDTANLSTGGTALDVTDRVHPLNRSMAERIARGIGLDIMGIDIVAQSLEVPLKQDVSGVVEVNAAPGFRMHLNPSDGTPRNIAVHVVDMLFPPGSQHSVPICAVTGTNGKTTTSMLIGHILRVNGRSVGVTSTDGVIINGEKILEGDYSGPTGARAVMMDPTVDHAVLEVARGGILRRGLGFPACDVGMILNISSDHLGEGGIKSLEQLTRLKSTVTEAVKPSGYAVFNADDPLALSCMEKSKGRPMLFSLDPEHPELRKNLDQGNPNVTIQKGRLILQKPDDTVIVCPVDRIPITYGGKAGFNVQNALAATAAAYALGLDEEEIKAGLLSFNPSIDQLPGRMNVIDMGEFTVIVDYNHNAEAVRRTGEYLKSLKPGRKIRLASGVGNRRTEDLLEFGRALSAYYDEIILCDVDPRGRKPGETARLVKKGLQSGGMRSDRITVAIDEKEATRIALEMAGPGDVVMLQADDIAQVIADVLAYKAKKLEERVSLSEMEESG